MAGQKQPMSLKLLKGNKHLTKAEIKKGLEEEIKAPADNVKAPSYLSKDLKREFKKIADELVKIGIMSNLDVDALARYLQSRKMYLAVTNKLLEMPVTIETEYEDDKTGELMTDVDENGVYAKLLNSQTKLFKQCREAASDLGLTISSRCKLVLPETKEKDKPKDPRAGKFGGV
jgi:P27 family predicted phage terminase small subunit